MITEERLRQTFSEGGAQEIYQEVKAANDFFGFARQYAFSQDYRVARSSLWGLTKASKDELSQLQVILNEFIEQAMQTENSSVRRLSLNVIERLELYEDDQSIPHTECSPKNGEVAFVREAIRHRMVQNIPNILWNPQLFVILRSKTARLGGASAIQASLIAFGLHEPCCVK